MNKRKIMKVFVNFITTFRCFFVFYLMFLFGRIQNVIFMLISAGLFFTDFIDGFLARKYHVQTNYGATMDTIADKILSIVLILLVVEKIHYLILILIGEIIIAFINLYGNFTNRRTKSSFMGKLKMWFLAITIILGYGHYFGLVSKIIVNIGCFLTFVLQIYVAGNYITYLSKQKKRKTRKKIQNFRDLIYRLFSTEYYLNTVH